MRAPHALIFAALIAATAVAGAQSQEGFRFKSGVDLVNVTATVTDEDGRFVSGLRREDFSVYEDGKLQDVSHFSADRVPVSLGSCSTPAAACRPTRCRRRVGDRSAHLRPARPRRRALPRRLLDAPDD